MLDRPVRILLVEDNSADARMIRDYLARDPTFSFELETRERLGDGLERLAAGALDVVLLDLYLPDGRGFQVFERLHQQDPEIPIIVLTGLDDRELALRAVAGGAQDYLVKDEIDGRSLVRSIHYAIERGRLQGQMRRFSEELERRVAERTRELEIYTYTVSHDLRSPLQIVSGYAQMLREDLEPYLGEEQRDYFDRLGAAVRRMSNLINALLILSRASRAHLRRETVDLGAVAANFAQALQREQPERRVRLVIADGLHAVGDPGLLSAVVENLVGNAWKFTSPREVATIEVGRLDGAGETVFFVRDDGIGFDMADAEQLFEPFRRLPTAEGYEGSGIGLATVRRVIERHGGRVWAEGAAGKGAAFFFTVPRPEDG